MSNGRGQGFESIKAPISPFGESALFSSFFEVGGLSSFIFYLFQEVVGVG